MKLYSLHQFARQAMFDSVQRTNVDEAMDILDKELITLESAPPPPVPNGYTMIESIKIEVDKWRTEDVIPFACYNEERILICSHIKDASLIKPRTLRLHWLWLHLLCFGAIETKLANAVLTKRIQPCIVGLKQQLPPDFALAYAAIQSIPAYFADIDNLPF